MSTEPEQARVEVHDDESALATAVAGELLIRLAEAQASGSVPQIGLTGGSIAGAVHRELGRLGPASGVDWSRVVVWWGDERFVATDSADRNESEARIDFLDVLGVASEHVHPMPATDSGLSLDEAAASYARDLREHGSGEFDVLMLGLGPDGHVASLFPGNPALDVAGAIAVAVTDSPKPPPERISLTFDALNRSRAVWFLVSGDAKAEAVVRALGGAERHDVPAAGVTGSVETTWFLDRAAASRL